jgi:VWFA-related protein
MHRICLACSTGILLMLWLPAAAAQKQEIPGRVPVLRVTTRLVQVSVVVHDRKGQPVSNLTTDDFVLQDEGKAQKIAVFDVESNQPSRRELAPLPPDTWSNELERRPGAPTSLTVILFDTLNTQWTDQVYARRQVVKFLEQLRPQDVVAIYTLGNGLRVVHDFTRDTASLLRALARYKGRINTEVDASIAEVADTGDAALDAMLNASYERMANSYLERRVETTLGAMQAIANHLAALPGRKNLIWVSGSFPFSYGLDLMGETSVTFPDIKVFNEEIARASRAVNNANLAIYPVDARGLIGFFAYNPSFGASTGGMSRAQAAALDARTQSQITGSFFTMLDLADRTGGRAFYNTNDIMGSIRRAIDDSRVTYVLGFYPREEDWNGKFHRLKVIVKRPGTEVHYRQGFYALPDQAADEQQSDKLIAAVARSPLEATAITLRVHLDPPAPPSEPLRFQTKLDLRDLSMQQRDGRWTGSLRLTFQQKDSEGKVVLGKTETVTLRLTPSTYEKMMADGMQISGEWQIVPQAEQLRIMMCDEPSGALGSVTVPLPATRGRR